MKRKICYIGIGSNLGNRRGYIHKALGMINSIPLTRGLRLSSLFETEPQGGPPGQRKFINCVLKAESGLAAEKLLNKLKGIEKELGRTRTVRNGPRVIDLDILLYGGEKIISRGLRIPHSRMYNRDFVLRPLLEVI